MTQNKSFLNTLEKELEYQIDVHPLRTATALSGSIIATAMLPYTPLIILTTVGSVVTCAKAFARHNGLVPAGFWCGMIPALFITHNSSKQKDNQPVQDPSYSIMAPANINDALASIEKGEKEPSNTTQTSNPPAIIHINTTDTENLTQVNKPGKVTPTILQFKIDKNSEETKPAVKLIEARYCAALLKLIEFYPDKPIDDVIQIYAEIASIQQPDIVKEIETFKTKYNTLKGDINNLEDFKLYLQAKADKNAIKSLNTSSTITDNHYCSGLLKLIELCPDQDITKTIRVYTELESAQNPDQAAKIKAFGTKYQKLNEAMNNFQDFKTYLLSKTQPKEISQLTTPLFKVEVKKHNNLSPIQFVLRQEKQIA